MDIRVYQPGNHLSELQTHERVIAHIEAWRKKTEKRLRRARFLGYVALLLWVMALFVLVVPAIPYVWYKVFPRTTELLAERLGVTVDVGVSEFGNTIYEQEKPEEQWQPPFDPKLSIENRIIIESIKVNSEINEGDDWEGALKKGVWRVPELGVPTNRRMPMILAAHRFGYLTWTNDFRRKNSFYNLPKVANGDRIEVIWNQRRYVYEVFDGYTDNHIREYSADLILYTCELLNSDRRIVRYARLIEG